MSTLVQCTRVVTKNFGTVLSLVVVNQRAVRVPLELNGANQRVSVQVHAIDYRQRIRRSGRIATIEENLKA